MHRWEMTIQVFLLRIGIKVDSDVALYTMWPFLVQYSYLRRLNLNQGILFCCYGSVNISTFSDVR